MVVVQDYTERTPMSTSETPTPGVTSNYAEIASVLRNWYMYTTGQEIAFELAERFQKIDTSFDRGKFLEACGFSVVTFH